MIYVIGIIVLYFLGKGTLGALYKQDSVTDMGMTDIMLTGGIVVIGLAEAAHLGAIVLGRSFSDCVFLFLVGLAALLLGVAVLLIVRFSKKKMPGIKKPYSKEETVFVMVWLGIVLVQLLLIADSGKVYLTGDMTAETVNTMLTTNTMYQINPMTGQQYVQGIPMRLKTLCLPTLYAILCNLFRCDATELVWHVIPVFTLLGCYLAFYNVAESLFGNDRKKRSVFMIVVSLLLWVGDYAYGMDGFGLQYAGFRGVSIRMLILLPYTISMVLRKKWQSVCLCVLAEACIVWTMYGLGMCLLVAAGLLFAEVVCTRWKKKFRVPECALWQPPVSGNTEEVDQ